MKKLAPDAQRLETEYLAEVKAALAGRPGPEVAEILQSVREHITEAVADCPSGEIQPADMANILERLGSPASYAAEEPDAPDGPTLSLAAASGPRLCGLALASALALPAAIVVGVVIGAICHWANQYVLLAFVCGAAILIAGLIMGIAAPYAVRPGSFAAAGLPGWASSNL